jgi:hypothetical protein
LIDIGISGLQNVHADIIETTRRLAFAGMRRWLGDLSTGTSTRTLNGETKGR